MPAPCPHTSPRALVRLLVVALLLAPIWAALAPAVLRAQTCGGEVEPNDTEGNVQPQAGLFCVAGRLPDDDQDLYLWEVDAETAARPIVLTVTGVPSTATTAALFKVDSEPGVEPIVGGSRLLDVTTNPSDAGPVSAEALLPAGVYLLGISRSATADGSAVATEDYTLEASAGEALPDDAETEPNDDPTTATEVEGAFAVSADLEGSVDTFAWTLSEKNAALGWEIGVLGPLGLAAEMALVDEAGTTLASVRADALGRMALYDLALDEGVYLLQMTGETGVPHPYGLTATAVDRPETDLEPNDTAATASAPAFSAGVVPGRLTAGDVDVYRLPVDEGLGATLFDIRVIRRSEAAVTVCLTGADGQDLQCKTGPGGATLSDIALPGGEYTIEVGGDPEPDVPYVLRVDATSAPVADFETEPNDAVPVASAFEPAITMRGAFVGAEDDYFRIPITGDPQLWLIRAEGAGVEGLSLQGANGRELAATAAPPDSGSAELTDLYLPPGDHWVRVRGADGEYTVKATPLGPPDPNGEREANNDPILGEPLLVGQVRTGRVVQTADVDYYRFSLAARDHVVVDLAAPTDASLLVRVQGATGELARWGAAAAGDGFRYDAMLDPGDYVVVVGASQPSTDRYALTVERADPFDLADDQEPNGTTTTAGRLPAEGKIRGDISLPNDIDWYALPPGAAGDLELVVEGDNVRLALSDGLTEYALAVDAAGERYTPTEPLPDDVPLYVIVSGTGRYRLGVAGDEVGGGSIFEVPGVGDRPGAVALPVTAALSLPVAEVAAYSTVGQRVEGELTLANDGAEPLTLDLQAVTSHYAWQVEVGESSVELAEGQTTTVPVAMTILADAWANVPVRVTVAASDADGRLASAFAEITPTALAPAVGPTQSWPIPDALLGGLDVAATALGATTVSPVEPDDEAQLHDGITPDGLGYVVAPPLPLTTTVDLAGDGPLPIAGFIIDPQAGDVTTSPPREVELLLSTDGATFDVAWTGELSPLPIEQAIALDAPVEAAYTRLVVTSAYSGNALVPNAVAIGEWKVIASPGATPEPYLGADIASGALGGHVVRLEPQASDDSTFPPSLLDEDRTRQAVSLTVGTTPSFVVGFHDDRAARISELQWVDPDGSTPEGRIDEVRVEVSIDGPLGPWEPLATWELERADDGTVAPLVLDEVRWARFLRLTGGALAADVYDFEYPATVRVIEEAATGEYRSILGEWGAAQPEGPYEALNPPKSSVDVDEPDAPDSPAEAAALEAGEEATGRANIGADIDWYAVTIPEGQNTLTFDVTGVPVVDVTVEVFDAGQEPVAARLVEGATPGSVQYVAEVEAGGTYTVRVAQPQHSIVFAFDTSGSIGPYYDAVFQALRSYTANVREGQEFVDIVAFDEKPLLEDWTDDPYALSTAVSRYRLTTGGSSSAETGVLDATDLLATQEGTKAILLITDAETSSYANADDMWQALETVGPRIFAVHIGAISTHNQAQDWMQDWAISSDGFYSYTRTQAEMDRAFDRAATWLRRPAGYGISYATSETSTEPGSLRVVSPPVDEAAGEEAVSTISDAVSVEIVYDTSGSMLATMADGQRRVDAARAVLIDLVTTKIPAGVPVALRVFGDTPGSCETTLAAPLAPLDPAAMGATIAGIEPVNEVKTPIGASLDLVASDLAGVEGPKIVILVTDGEETCDGDAEAAIARLAVEGVDVQVNIVGFALDDEALKSTFRRWARLGNGTYFDATNAEELDDAIARAVQAPFRVYDAGGDLVASGTVDGGSVKLPAGTYRVVVLTDPETVYEEVVVAPEGKVKLTLGE